MKRDSTCATYFSCQLPFVKTSIWTTAAYGQLLFTVYPAAAPLSTAVPLLFIGTVTLTVAVAVLPNESVTLNVIV